MQVRDTPLRVNERGATVTLSVGAGGSGIYYGPSESSVKTNTAAPGAQVTITSPMYVQSQGLRDGPPADLDVLGEDTASASSGSGGVFIDATSSTYGADKTGATDATAAIQAALDAAKAAGGGVVFLPAGTYQITQLLMRRYVRLTGSGYDTVLQRKSGSGAHMIVVGSTGAAGDFFWELDHLSVDGNKAIDGNTAADCLFLDGGQSPGMPTFWGPFKHSPVTTIHNLFIHNAPRDSLHMTNALREAQVHSIFAQRAGRHNYYCEGGTYGHSDCFFDRCISAFAGSHGFNVSSWSVHFVNCKVWWSGKSSVDGSLSATAHGYFISAGNYNVFEGCEAQDNAGSGVCLQNCTGNRFFGASSGSHDDAVRFDNANENHVSVTTQGTTDGWTTGNGLNFINASTGNKVDYKVVPGAVATYLTGAAVGNAVDINQQHASQSPAYLASLTVDPLKGGTATVGTLTGNIAIGATPVGWRGLRLRFIFTQDATGGRTVTFDASFKTNWTPNTAAGKVNVIDFEHNGVNWVQVGSVVGL